MKSCADAVRAARSIWAWVASGWPKAMFAATVFENRKLSWKTRPMLRRRSSSRRRAHVDAVHEEPARGHVVKPRDQAHQHALPGAGRAQDRDALAGLDVEVDPRRTGSSAAPGVPHRRTTHSRSARRRRVSGGKRRRARPSPRSGRRGSRRPGARRSATAAPNSRCWPRCSPDPRTGRAARRTPRGPRRGAGGRGRPASPRSPAGPSC